MQCQYRNIFMKLLKWQWRHSRLKLVYCVVILGLLTSTCLLTIIIQQRQIPTRIHENRGSNATIVQEFNESRDIVSEVVEFANNCDDVHSYVSDVMSKRHNPPPCSLEKPVLPLNGTFRAIMDLEEAMCTLASHSPTAFVDVEAIRTQYPRTQEEFWKNIPLYDNCAIVGSSGRLNRELKNHAEAIDRSDMVWRFNSAPTKGFERLIGSKTTIRSINTYTLEKIFQHPFLLEDNYTIFTAFYPAKLDHLPAVNQIWQKMQQKERNLHPIWTFSRNFQRWTTCWVEELTKTPASIPTHGVMGLLFSSLLCKNIDLYGFGSFEPRDCFHYFEKVDSRGSCPAEYREWYKTSKVTDHNLLQEREFVKLFTEILPCVRFH